MYSDQVKDIILERMLKVVDARFDKREGSIIWDALAPAAVEFENFFIFTNKVTLLCIITTRCKKSIKTNRRKKLM